MAENDHDIMHGKDGCIYKHEHGNDPIISGSKIDYNIHAGNSKYANRAMHGSKVDIRHRNRREF
jgi:hypothetical protein